MPPPTDLSPFIAQLEDKGYCVIPNVVPKDLTTQARQLVDAIIGAPPPPSPSLGLEKVPTGPPGDPNARGQPGPWPVKGDNRPTIQSGGYTHSLHHPMPDGDYGFSGLMAKILQPYVQINAALLRCPESEVPNLKLMQQLLWSKRLPAPCSMMSSLTLTLPESLSPTVDKLSTIICF